MKIKSDFVTNSSSTAYIVAIPNDFEPDQEVILEKSKDHFIYKESDEEWPETRILEDFSECLALLKSGDNIWTHRDEEGCDSRIFYTMVDICNDNGFVLSIFELNNEDGTRIQGITEEDINGWFMDTQLQKLKIEVPDEQN
ncbi:MAG: hypothetical protein DRN27_08930 [Thermoplasmata archaeon]|nr:MAG: hypothetical protein DRN27_08930 [Thermoplasmata archaeon]